MTNGKAGASAAFAYFNNSTLKNLYTLTVSLNNTAMDFNRIARFHFRYFFIVFPFDKR